MALTDMEIRKAKPQEKRYVLRDSEGLALRVHPSGKKTWIVRCMVNRKTLAKIIGEYPAMGIREARIKRNELRLGLQHGGTNDTGTFRTLAEEWYKTKVEPIRVPRHAETVWSRLDRLVLPYLGDHSPREITAPELLQVLRRIEARGHIELAHRTCQIVGQVLRYGIATGTAERDVAADLRGALTPRKAEHYPTITDPQGIGGLMSTIHGLPSVIIRCALLFQAYTAVRPGELRHAEWKEISGDLWKIPAGKMKMRKDHLVPLSEQALAVLQTLCPITGEGAYLFPSFRTPRRPISDVTVNAALRRLGYSKEEFTGHSFRSMFSTIANENQWPPDVIERQLAHAEKNAVRAAYNHAEFLEQRKELMRWWGKWLEEREKER